MEAQVTSFGPKYARGTCKVCGKPAYKGSATTCDEHRKGSKAPKKAPLRTMTADAPVSPEEIAAVNPAASTRVEVPKAVPAVVSGDAKKDRAAKVKAQLLTEGNEGLLKSFAFVMKPVPAENFFTVSDTGTLSATAITAPILIAEWEAAILGKAVAELETNPMIQGATAMASPVVPYAAGAGALAVILFHAYNMINLRTEVLNQWNAAQQAAAVQAGAQAPQAEEAATAPVEPEQGKVLRPVFSSDMLDTEVLS